MCPKFVKKGKGKTKRAGYFFPWRHKILVGFEDVCQSLPDVFFFHAGQNGGRQEQRKTPLLSAERRLISE